MSQEQSDIKTPPASILPALVVVAVGFGVVYLSRARTSASPSTPNTQQTFAYTSSSVSPNTSQVRSSINALLDDRFK